MRRAPGKGTAKSTAVRGLAALLSAATGSDANLVEMPLGATEDRVIGSLDLQRVLRDGEHAFSPGLLARAHGGVLYVDEVNLLHDHLVDVLLDAAAMGRVHIERDGISHSHDARFVLIGTMNPEEGELRPQLLDRFGLTVDVHASRDVEVRAQVIRQRMAYEADPDGFAERYADADAELARRIAAARALVDDVVLPDTELRRIAALCAAFDVDGMRADLVVARAAVGQAGETEQQPPQRDSAQDAKPRPPTTKPSAPPSKTFRTRALRVPGVGEGAPGRRSRARNASGSVIAATDGADTGCGGHGLHLFAPTMCDGPCARVAKAIW